jgi:predicted metal-dependent phosphoesterase TrpH
MNCLLYHSVVWRLRRETPKLYKADLHVHSRYSGPAKHLRFFRCLDCYSWPLDIYRKAKRRGMDLVTITDHDAIDGCLDLLNRSGDLPDFIMGEEVSAYLPQFQHHIHIGVYGHSEAQHREIQSLRANGEELVAYLRQQDLLFVLNHFFHDFAVAQQLRPFVETMRRLFTVYETRNGSQERAHNLLNERLVEQFRMESQSPVPLGVVGGSDAHTLRRIGRTYTASPARDRAEFLRDIRAGRTQVFGEHSTHRSLAADIYGVVLRYYPHVLALQNGEFNPVLRLQNITLSLLAMPLLIAPYVAAVRHSRIEHRRVQAYARSLHEVQRSSPAPPQSPPPVL